MLVLCLLAAGLPAARAQFGITLTNISWNSIGLAASPGRIVSVLADPRGNSTLYLVATGGGIWKSQDGGMHWNPQFDSLYSPQACSLAIDPNAPDTLYAGTGDDQSPRPAQGVARSTDGGQNWNIGMRFTSQPVCSLAKDPANSSNVLAGSGEGLFLSTDAASTWRKVRSYPVTSIVYDRKGNVYVGELGPDNPGVRNSVLARSSDGGKTWTSLPLPVTSAASNTVTNFVAIQVADATINLVVSYGQYLSANFSMDFYTSSDAGVTWAESPSIGPAEPPLALFADSASSILYVTGPSLLSSPDQGVTWSPVTTATKDFHTGLRVGDSLLLAGEVVIEFVPLSTGALQRQIALPLAQYLDVTMDSSGSPWAAGPGGLYGRFRPGVFGSRLGSVAAATLPTSQNIFSAANTGVYHSTNQGVDFTSTTVIPSGELRAPYPPLVINPTSPATAYLAGRRLYRTTNSGATWTLLSTIDPNPNNVTTALATAPATDGGARIMYAATACLPEIALSTCPTGSTIWQSTNTGATWTQRSTVLGLINRLAVDPRQANTVYAAGGGFPGGPSGSAGYLPGDLHKSTDGGATWISVLGNLPRVPINAIAIDPNSVVTLPPPPGGRPAPPSAQRIYVGTDAGVFVTFNAGSQWTQINTGLPSVAITQLSLQGSNLLAASFGRGAFQANVGSLSASLVASPLSLNLTLNQGIDRDVALTLSNVNPLSLDWQMTPLDTWLSVPVSRGTLPSNGSLSSNVLVSSSGLAIGTYLGRIQLTTGNFVQQIYVTLQVTTPPASISIVSGNNASGAGGTTLPPFVVSFSDPSGAPVPGVQVSFQISSSGGGSLSTTSTTTDSSGTARTTLTLPTTPGPVQVTASSGSFSVTFTATATVAVAPSLLSNNVVNGATFNSAIPPSPGTILAIMGANLATDTQAASTVPLPISIRNTSILLDSADGEILLPLLAVSPNQVNALLPYDLPPGIYSLRVESNSVSSNAVSLTVAQFSPGIFTMSSNGQGQGIFVNAITGSLITASNPAARGSYVTLYATGLGAVDPAVVAGGAGASAEPFNRTLQTPRVFFDSSPAEVLYSGLAPGFAGIYQVNVRVPSTVTPASNVSVSLSIGAAASNRVAIPVR